MHGKELDRIDHQILEELSTDSRQSLRQLAKKLGVAITTVGSRMEKLKDSGVIKGFTIEVDHDKMGYDLCAIIDVTARTGNSLFVCREFAKTKNAVAIYDVTGSTDSIIVAKFRNRKEMNEYLRKVLNMDEIERTDTHIVLETIKENTCWLPAAARGKN